MATSSTKDELQGQGSFWSEWEQLNLKQLIYTWKEEWNALQTERKGTAQTQLRNHERLFSTLFAHNKRKHAKNVALGLTTLLSHMQMLCRKMQKQLERHMPMWHKRSQCILAVRKYTRMMACICQQNWGLGSGEQGTDIPKLITNSLVEAWWTHEGLITFSIYFRPIGFN